MRVLLLALLLAGCGATATVPPTTVPTPLQTASPVPSPSVPVPSASPVRIIGTISLPIKNASVTITGSGSTCEGKGGYDDIRPGARVAVADGRGTVIATGGLGEGVVGTGCVFPFIVDVPDATFYSIEVSHRGALTYSRAELEERGWTVAFTLG